MQEFKVMACETEGTLSCIVKTIMILKKPIIQ